MFGMSSYLRPFLLGIDNEYIATTGMLNMLWGEIEKWNWNFKSCKGNIARASFPFFYVNLSEMQIARGRAANRPFEPEV